ncbi:ankyrin repeat domain-containing protein [Fluoribacter gormanii]|uniref:Dot/Icm T4SS effector AnkG/AnkZ/LegA7 n=1 Tax=Fluoribacter gormanii TaxID=464 RepID=UPI0022432879|nr:Dot/Icm T4SS effector AnkG/AnkZ/LegA7 [Fluoribacter gormanii]MCW8469690.1 ankyrin repeat domain-containing protein [Fluoribacter gormanii]
MIYALFVLILIFLLIVVHQHLISFNRVISTLFTYTTRRNALEHEELLALFDKFNYQHDDGVCHGFTLTWAQEAALGLDYQFYNRLNLIKREKQTLPNSLDAITEKIKSSQTLSRKEQKRNEIRPFFEAICLAQSPDDYYEFYAQTLQQSNIDAIYKMIQLHFSRTQNTVKNLFGKTMSFASFQDLNKFLNNLNEILFIKNDVVIVCSSEEHTVGFKKHKSNVWLFMDINHLYEQSEDYPYQLLTSEELCPVLYQSLFETSEQLVVHCAFIAKPGQRRLIQKIQSLDELFPVNLESTQINNCRGYGPLAIGVQNDDRNTVSKILRLHNKSSVISQSELEHAFFYAAACNRSNIMNHLKNIPKIDINIPCNKGRSPLGVACEYGNESVVQLLLRDKNINVNIKDSKEMTPLMLACKSSYTQKNPALFKLLLDAGANTALMNLNGETAYEIAKNHDNQTALNIMASYSAKACHQFPPDTSPVPLATTRKTSNTMLSFLKHTFFDKHDVPSPAEEILSSSAHLKAK